MPDEENADDAQRLHQQDTRRRKCLIGQQVGFKFEKQKQQKPGCLIEGRREGSGPIVPPPAVMHGVAGDGDVVDQVMDKVDQQERVHKHLDGLPWINAPYPGPAMGRHRHSRACHRRTLSALLVLKAGFQNSPYRCLPTFGPIRRKTAP
jgi:hypothetical protein